MAHKLQETLSDRLAGLRERAVTTRLKAGAWLGGLVAGGVGIVVLENLPADEISDDARFALQLVAGVVSIFSAKNGIQDGLEAIQTGQEVAALAAVDVQQNLKAPEVPSASVGSPGPGSI